MLEAEIVEYAVGEEDTESSNDNADKVAVVTKAGELARDTRRRCVDGDHDKHRSSVCPLYV